MADLNDHLGSRAVDLMAADSGDEAARAHVATCAACAGKVSAARAERELFLAANSPSLRAAQLLAAPRPRPRAKPSRWLWLVPTTSLAAAMVFVLWRPSAPQPELLDKGGPSVSLTVKHGDGAVTAAHSGDLFAAGDAVQLSVTVSAPSQVAVFSVGNGLQRIMSEELARSGPLEHSLVLDAAREDERLWVVIARSEAAIGAWEVQARRAPATAPPAISDGTVEVVVLRKSAP